MDKNNYGKGGKSGKRHPLKVGCDVGSWKIQLNKCFEVKL
jgi:hypothetical protein